MIGRTNAGSGTGATLTVEAPALCTVTVSKDGKSKTKVADTAGVAVFKGLSSGEWTLSITDGEQTAQKTVTITADYVTEMSFFVATINVTYPEGSVCTATDGVTTLTSDNSGSWAFVVPNAGTWTVSLDNGFSEDVVITSNGQIATIDKWYLYKSGNEYTDRTGGWSKGVHTVSDGLGTVTKQSTSVYFHTPDTSSDDCPLSTSNEVDLSKFNTLYAEFVSISGTKNVEPNLCITYLSVRGLRGSSGSSGGKPYNGSSSQIVAVDISNVGVPKFVSVGIFAYDDFPVNTAYLTSVWAV